MASMSDLINASVEINRRRAMITNSKPEPVLLPPGIAAGAYVDPITKKRIASARREWMSLNSSSLPPMITSPITGKCCGTTGLRPNAAALRSSRKKKNLSVRELASLLRAHAAKHPPKTLRSRPWNLISDMSDADLAEYISAGGWSTKWEMIKATDKWLDERKMK